MEDSASEGGKCGPRMYQGLSTLLKTAKDLKKNSPLT